MTDLVTRTGPGALDPLLNGFTGMVHDGAGNRLSLNASIPAHVAYSGTTNYTYDTKDQLTQESSTRAGGYTNNFVYDPAGNPTSFKGVSHSYNANNQQAGSVYDGNGNPTTYKGVTCTFDPENRMTAYGALMTAGYCGDGLRAWKQTAAGRTYFLYDGEVLLAELNAAGTVTAVNTWGAGGLVSRTTPAGTVFYTFDPQGSVAQRLDGAGSVLTNHVFDGHGIEASTGTGDCYAFGALFGYYSDASTGLQLLTSRYYDRTSGRFINRDPSGPSGGINLYAFCGNSPIGFADPSGNVRFKTRGGKQWDVHLNDPDTNKGLPHADGAGENSGNWVDNTGKIHHRDGSITDVDKKDWPKFREQFNNWSNRTGNRPTPPDAVKDQYKPGDGWWWNPGCGWEQDKPVQEDKSFWSLFTPLPRIPLPRFNPFPRFRNPFDLNPFPRPLPQPAR